MKKVLALLVTIALCLVAYSTLTVKGQGQSRKDKSKFRKVEKSIPNEYIVVLKDDTDSSSVQSLTDELVHAHGGNRRFVYKSALKGFSVQMPERAAEALSHDPRVEYVIENGEVSGSTTQFNPPSWGLDRIDQRDLPLNNAYTYNSTGAGVNAYVLDSGIRPTHQDFGGRASIAADFVGDGQGGNDCHGHGTHVAGTLGGSSYGVAKGVRIYAVRVLNCSGNGTFDGVIAGVEWVTNNRVSPAVANMSLGGSAYEPLDTAVRNSIASGVTYAVSAGNDYGLDASQKSPARVSEALTVGATDMADVRADFSNVGSVLDVFAPGVNITSAWIGSDIATNTISGTSMASPHVAGVAALYLQSNPGATPATVSSAITNNATVGKVINPGPGSPNRLLYSIFAAPPTGQPVPKDYDGDGRTDIAVWRESEGKWYILRSSNSTIVIQSWGQAGDQPVPSDYDGDGRADLAIWRESEGKWYVLRSSNGTNLIQGWGQAGDKPVPGDYDGDGRTDMAIWRESEGKWYILRSSNGTNLIQGWGQPGDLPMPGDYDGDGKDDFAIWRESEGKWYVLRSSNGTNLIQGWGQAGDLPVHGDYDGDGRTDMAIWRESEGKWYVSRSSNGTNLIQGWGQAGDKPVPGDYDGDGKDDLAVWRESEGTWYILESSTGVARIITGP